MAGASYVLVDFPRMRAKAGESGGRRCVGGFAGLSGGLSRLRTLSTGVWTIAGNYEWVVIRTEVIEERSAWKMSSGGRRSGGLITTSRRFEFIGR